MSYRRHRNYGENRCRLTSKGYYGTRWITEFSDHFLVETWGAPSYTIPKRGTHGQEEENREGEGANVPDLPHQPLDA